MFYFEQQALEARRGYVALERLKTGWAVLLQEQLSASQEEGWELKEGMVSC